MTHEHPMIFIAVAARSQVSYPDPLVLFRVHQFQAVFLLGEAATPRTVPVRDHDGGVAVLLLGVADGGLFRLTGTEIRVAGCSTQEAEPCIRHRISDTSPIPKLEQELGKNLATVL